MIKICLVIPVLMLASYLTLSNMITIDSNNELYFQEYELPEYEQLKPSTQKPKIAAENNPKVKTNLNKNDFKIGIENWLYKKFDLHPNISKDIAENAKSLDHGLMIVAILAVESEGNPNARLKNNYGLCQVSDIHLKPKELARIRNSGFKSLEDCGISDSKDLFDIDANMCAANAIFDRLYKSSNGNTKIALLNYNANEKLKHGYQYKVMKNYNSLTNFLGINNEY